MSIADVTENAILNLVFAADAWANYAINATASPETNIVIALHTAPPADTDNMAAAEATYTSYTRVNRTRDHNASTGWTTSSTGSISPQTNIDFPAGTGGSGTVNAFSTGKSGGGATAILWSGSVSPSIVTGSGVTPRLTTATTITLD